MFIVCVAAIVAAVPAIALVVGTTTKTKKGTAKVPGSPAKSPARKAKDCIQIPKETNRKRKPFYSMKILKLKADFELIWCESAPNKDGYMYPAHVAVTNRDTWATELGLILVANRRINSDTEDILLNAGGGYFRKVIIRAVPEDIESTPETRLAVLRTVAEFCAQPENNKYGYDFTVDDNSDLTPAEAGHLENADEYILSDDIVSVVLGMYEKTGLHWYNENKEYADKLLTGPDYHAYAVTTLGYPAGGAMHRRFNPPNGSNA